MLSELELMLIENRKSSRLKIAAETLIDKSRIQYVFGNFDIIRRFEWKFC